MRLQIIVLTVSLCSLGCATRLTSPDRLYNGRVLPAELQKWWADYTDQSLTPEQENEVIIGRMRGVEYAYTEYKQRLMGGSITKEVLASSVTGSLAGAATMGTAVFGTTELQAFGAVSALVTGVSNHKWLQEKTVAKAMDLMDGLVQTQEDAIWSAIRRQAPFQEKLAEVDRYLYAGTLQAARQLLEEMEPTPEEKAKVLGRNYDNNDTPVKGPEDQSVPKVSGTGGRPPAPGSTPSQVTQGYLFR